VKRGSESQGIQWFITRCIDKRGELLAGRPRIVKRPLRTAENPNYWEKMATSMGNFFLKERNIAGFLNLILYDSLPGKNDGGGSTGHSRNAGLYKKKINKAGRGTFRQDGSSQQNTGDRGVA